MSDFKPSYSIIGVSLNNKESAVLALECERCDRNRAEVIKQALKYWLSLDPATRDRAIIST